MNLDFECHLPSQLSLKLWSKVWIKMSHVIEWVTEASGKNTLNYVSQVRSLQGTHNAARRVLDSVTSLSGSVSEVTILEHNIFKHCPSMQCSEENQFLLQVSSAPAANLARWAADQVLPIFLSREHLFIQNSIFGDVGGSFLLETKCRNILLPLLQPKVANIIITSMMTSYHRFGITDTLHHCRACGEGFCHTCSDYKVKAFDIFVSMKNIHYSSQRHDRLPNYNSSEPMSWPRMGISARESVQELLRARYCLPVG